MENLQELLDGVKNGKFGKVTEGRITLMIRGLNSVERLHADKEGLKQRGKTLGSTVGKLNMTDYSREMSKVPTTCPNCNTIGPLSNMVQHHMDNCKRTVGYSDNLIIENYIKGMSSSQISKDANVSQSQIKVILNLHKENGGVLPVKETAKSKKKLELENKKLEKEILHNSIINLKLQGYSQSEIIKELNTSNGTVSRVILNHKKSLAVSE
jgi:transposase